MSSTATLYCRNISKENVTAQNIIPTLFLKFSAKQDRKLLKVFLLSRLHQLFCDLFKNKMQCNQNNSSMECYTMDSKIIQLLIQGIIETGEYTLEGISYRTRIPFDVIFDAACGISNQFSITPWVRIVDLYIQVNPEIAQALFDKLIEIKDKNYAAILALLNE